MTIKLIAYRRVSTRKQGQSGLGLEAQEESIAKYAVDVEGLLVHTYTEVESGKRNDRPELAKALAHARRIKGRLVIAKLDRLTRNARFLLGIVESGADVAFCELPQVPPGPMGKFFLTMMAAVAELERGMISERTRGALGRYKAGMRVSKRVKLIYQESPDGVPADVVAERAGKLGSHIPECSHNLDKTPGSRRKGSVASGLVAKARADEAYHDLMPAITAWRAEGRSPRQIAARLNAEGHTTRRGKPWNHVQVMRVLKRFAG